MIEALKNIGFVVTERLERKELSSDLQNRYSMGHRTKRFFQWSGKMGERL